MKADPLGIEPRFLAVAMRTSYHWTTGATQNRAFFDGNVSRSRKLTMKEKSIRGRIRTCNPLIRSQMLYR